MTGSDLKKFRLNMQMSQRKFGEELGFCNPQVQISQFENGKRPINKRLIAIIRKWKEVKKGEE